MNPSYHASSCRSLSSMARRARIARVKRGATLSRKFASWAAFYRSHSRADAERVGLRAHGTLVQYENGRVLPPLDRLAALATAYNVPLSSLVVSRDALIPVVTMLERGAR